MKKLKNKIFFGMIYFFLATEIGYFAFSPELAMLLKKPTNIKHSEMFWDKLKSIVLETVEGFKKYINEFGFISPEEIREIVSKERINSPKLVGHFGTVSHTYQKKIF